MNISDVIKYGFSWMIILPNLFCIDFAVYCLQGFFETFNFSDFLQEFYIIYGAAAIPILFGILVDNVGVINLLPLTDVFLIIGEVCLYFALQSTPENKILAMTGLFFIYLAMGIKDIAKIVFYGNTFVSRRRGTFTIKTLAYQIAISLSLQYLLLIGFNNFIYYVEIDHDLVSEGIIICIGIGCFSFVFDMILRNLVKQEIGNEESFTKSLIKATDAQKNGEIFNFYNDRYKIPECENPSFIQIMKSLLFRKQNHYIIFWLLASSSFVSVTSFDQLEIIYWAGYNKGLAVLIAITLIMGFAFYTERKVRFIILLMGLLLMIYELYDLWFKLDTYVQWIELLAIPTVVQASAIQLPVYLHFDLSCFGIITGLMTWLTNLFQIFSGYAELNQWIRIYLFASSIFGMLMLLIFNEKYLYFKELNFDSNSYKFFKTLAINKIISNSNEYESPEKKIEFENKESSSTEKIYF